MPKLVNEVPKYRRHATGQAVVTLGRRDHYLGKHGSKASKQKYTRLVAEWLASDRPATVAALRDITVTEVCAAFLRFARTHYVKNGEITDEVSLYRVLVRHLQELYGPTPATDFGPKGLKAFQAKMVAGNAARSYVNALTRRVKHLFKWAAAEELIPVETYTRLTVVPGLQKGRTEARETAPVKPIADAVVEATLPHLRPVIVAMVRFQRLTVVRPDEVCRIRPMDIDRSDEVWQYVPDSHKTEHKGRPRLIFIGPQAQEVLQPYLFGDDLPCFRGPLSPRGFNTRSYRSAVNDGCDRAFPAPAGVRGQALKKWRSEHRWSPNRLRHAAATEIRAKFGLEAAQVALGHSRADVTQVYAERDRAKGIEVARMIG